jgi:hypothetical protein
MLDEQQLGKYIDAHFTSTLFRLETLDKYDVSGETDDYRRYLSGQPGPMNKQPWMDVIRNEVARGLHTYRVHVVRSPLTDYLRYEFEWGYAYNAEAGEHIRILDTADQCKPDAVIDEDFWLIDNQHALVMHYSPDGAFLGASIAERESVPRYVAASEAAWSAATDFANYWRRHPQFWRIDRPPEKGADEGTHQHTLGNPATAP